MKKACLSLVLLASFGCLEEEEVDPQVGESTAAIEPGFCTGICHYNTPCDTACLTHPGFEEITCGDHGQCTDLQDIDYDGVQAQYDNCDYTYNPDQANCDGDNRGDACDDENGDWNLESVQERRYIFGTTPGPDPMCRVWNSVRYTYRDLSACGGGVRTECDRYHEYDTDGPECGYYGGSPICY